MVCHRPEQVGPFELTSYEDAVGWAETIREVIQAGRMPPWHADPRHGQFANDARLPEEAKKQIEAWIAGGCPEGHAKDLPAPPEFADGWQIPQPDVVYKIPEPFEVPAKGTVPYQYFTIDPGFKEDKWIKAAECRPGNRSVTHHLILFFHPPGQKGFDAGEPLFNSIVGFAPGLPPSIYPEGIYRLVPAGSKLLIQAHYTPNGTPQTDQSEVGIVFADPATVRREMKVGAALNWQFRIPAGADNHRVSAVHKFEQETILYTLTPHMHLRGKSFLFEAIYPDGREEVLLDVPRYDFNWQNTYLLAEPKLMPEGTQVRCTAHYDNSADNLANPDSDEARDVGRSDLAGDDGRHLRHGSGRAGPVARLAAHRAGRRRRVRSHVHLPAHGQGGKRAISPVPSMNGNQRTIAWTVPTRKATTRRS